MCGVPATRGTALNPDQQDGDQEETGGTVHFCVNTAYLAHLWGLLCVCIFYTPLHVYLLGLHTQPHCCLELKCLPVAAYHLSELLDLVTP